ncbi:MAG: CDP-alcohol phosphatidyltransferase family protein [Lachnospiraceae bacterium]|nr:CDP-alcohol phosphatidyltransferase family protein [Lachnospiraceae bacterium]
MKMKKPLGYYNYTVVLTYLGMLMAFTGILFAFNENYSYSIIFLIGAGICDMFDGAVASTKERDDLEKKFGIQIDSLSDLVSFGIMPAVFVYMISGRTLISGLIAALYSLAALIRLAYFNVSEEERQKTTNERRKSYLGMPVTTISILMPLAYLIQYRIGVQDMRVYLILLILCAICFLLPVEVKKFDIVSKF